DIRGADVYGAPDGMALEVYRGIDTFGRLDAEGKARVERDLVAALDGSLPLKERLAERLQRYRRAGAAGPVRVTFDLEASPAATARRGAGAGRGGGWRAAAARARRPPRGGGGAAARGAGARARAAPAGGAGGAPRRGRGAGAGPRPPPGSGGWRSPPSPSMVC